MVELNLAATSGFVSTHKHIFCLGNLSSWVLLCCFHFLPILLKNFYHSLLFMAPCITESCYSDVGHRSSENYPTSRALQFCCDALGGTNSQGQEQLVKIE